MVSKKEMLIAETNKVISEYTTRLTVRQIFYRLVSRHIIPNTMLAYKYLDKVLVDARWDGSVGFAEIEDRTRQFLGGDHTLHSPKSVFESWLEAFETCDKYHKLPMWLDQDYYVEVWLEKQALQGLFEEVTSEYNVTLFPCRGYPSLTKLYESSERISGEGGNREVKILYYGDYDPSGEDIPRKVEEDLNRLGVTFSIEKIAILREQIEKYDIPPMPAKQSDPRYRKFVETHGDEAVELDAIDPKILQDIVRDSIVDLFNQDTRYEVEERQEKERAEIRKLIEQVLKKKTTTK